MPANMPNFNFEARLVSEIWGGGGPKLKSGSSWFPYRRCLADKFLYRALVRVNAYKCAKFQLPLVTEIWRGSQNKNGRCWSPQTPHSGQIFVCSHSTCKCLSQRTKFQLSRSISLSIIWDIWGGPKIKSGSSWFPQTPPSGQIFIPSAHSFAHQSTILDEGWRQQTTTPISFFSIAFDLVTSPSAECIHSKSTLQCRVSNVFSVCLDAVTLPWFLLVLWVPTVLHFPE